MAVARSLSRYSTLAIILHWLIALLIFSNIVLAWVFQNTPQGLTWFKLIQLHKSVGITVLLLSVLRLAWRLFNPPPPLPAMPPWQTIAAKAAHWGFYVIMICMPLSGWVMVSASLRNLPTLLYGIVPWPHLAFIHDMSMDARKVWGHWAGTTHGALAWFAYILIVLHVAAALKHQFFDRDDLLFRMAPLGRPAAKEPPHAF
jgi:cytochrome b561